MASYVSLNFHFMCAWLEVFLAFRACLSTAGPKECGHRLPSWVLSQASFLIEELILPDKVNKAPVHPSTRWVKAGARELHGRAQRLRLCLP